MYIATYIVTYVCIHILVKLYITHTFVYLLFGGVLIDNLVVLCFFLRFYLYIVVGSHRVGWGGVG